MSVRCFFVCAVIVLSLTNAASASRFQRTKDGKTLVWNGQRGVAQEATWSGLRDTKGYATGEGTLIWYRLNEVVNSYTGKMVQGKFEGMVVKEQAGTRLQAKFTNGEKVGDWSEPGSTVSPTPKPASTEPSNKPAETQPTEEPIVARPSSTPSLLPTPLPSPKRSPSPSPTSRPTPSPKTTPTATPTSTPSPSPTPSPSLRPVATATPTPFPTLSPSVHSPAQETTKKTSRLEEVVEGPIQDSLLLASPSPSLRNTLEEVPWVDQPKASPSPTAIPRGVASKDKMITEFKEKTRSVLAQVSDATGNFHEIDRVDAVFDLPAEVTTNVAALANQARDFRAKLGYDIAFHECRVETETVDALTVVDQIARSFAEADAPAARITLLNFLDRYPEPPADSQKPLWHYLSSARSLCDRLKDEAATRLPQAKSLDSAGKTSEALREYQEIYRIYPNPVTAAKIRQLEAQPR